MWPMILGMSRDECKRILRRLELEAYANLVSAFRAQGELNSEKRKLLQDIAATLNISMERHRAEIRRAVNDEKLATIAEHIAGPNTEKNWAIEGRRLMPLMPRLVPQTAFTALANNVANIAAAENAKLPPPAETVKLSAKFGNKMVSPSFEPSVPEAIVPPKRSNSPTEMACSTPSPVVSQMRNNEEEENSRKRRQSSCEKTDSLSSPLLQPPPTKMTVVSAVVQSPSSASPQPKLPPDPCSRQNHHPQEQPLHQKLQQPIILLQSPTHQQLPKVQLQQALSCVAQQQQAQSLLHLQTPQPPPPQSAAQQRQQQQQQQQQQQLPQEQKQQLQEQKQQPHQQTHQQHQQPKEHQQLPSQTQPQPLQQHQQQRNQKVQQISQTSCIPKTESYPASIPPVKITLTAASSRLPVTAVTTSAVSVPPSTQKVIIMSSSGAPGSPSILQRSLSVPVVKTVSACGSSNASQRPSSLILSGQPHNRAPISPPGSTAVGNIVTISTSTSNSVTLPSSGATGGASTTTYIAQNTAPKLRTKSVQLPARIRTRPAGSIIIPMTPNQVSPATNTNSSSNNIQTTQLKPTAQAGKPCVAIKPDNSMKMVPMSNLGNSTKILPKPVFSSAVQSPVYVMTSATGGSLVTRTSSAGTVSRMVTINTASGPHPNSPLSDIRTAPTTVITKNISKPLQTVHISAQSSNVSKGIGGKPNVILVQKPSGSTLSRSITLPHGGKEILGKVLVGKSGIPAAGHSSVLSLVKSSHIIHPGTQQSGNVTTTATHGNVIVLDLSQEQLNKNSTTLSDILRVSGIIPEEASASETIPPEAVEEGKVVQHVVNIESTEAHTPSTDSEKQFTEKNTAANENTVPVEPVDEQETQVHTYSGEVSLPSRQLHEETVEMVGELDPQTGIYSVHPSHVSVKGNHECSEDSTESSEDTVPKSSSKTMDIFSTAIASADIDLETFSYNEGEKVALEEENENECTRQHSKMNNNNNNITVDSLSAQGGCAFITTTQQNQDHDFRSFLHENGSTTVASVFVEPTHMDTSEMHIEDFASQKIQAHEVA